MKYFKKGLALTLALALMLPTLSFAETSEPTFNVLESKLAAVKALNKETDLILVASILSDKNALHTAAKNELNANAQTKADLANVGITETNIGSIVEVLYSEIPTSSSTLNKTILGRIYLDDDAEYLEYAVEMKKFVRDSFYPALPQTLKDKLADYAGDLDAQLTVAEQVLMFMIDKKMGTATYTTATKTFHEGSLGIDSATATALNTEIAKYKKEGATTTTEEITDASVGIVNVSLKAAQKVLADYQNVDGDKILFDLLYDLNYLTILEKYVPDNGSGDSGDSGSSSSGSGSGSGGSGSSGNNTPSTPSTSVDTETKNEISKIDDAVSGTAEEQQAAVENVVEKVAESIDTVDNPAAVVNEMTKSIAKVMENIDGTEAVAVAQSQAALVSKALTNPNVTPAQAQTIAKDFISQVAVKAVTAENVNVKQVQQTIKKVVQDTINKAGNIDLKPVAGTLEVKTSDIAAAIANVEKAANELKQTLASNKMAAVTGQLKQQVTLDLGNVEADAGLSISETALEALASANVDVAVQAKGVTFQMPKSVVQGAQSTLAVENKALTSAQKSQLTTVTDSGVAKALKTFDLTVTTDSADENALNGTVGIQMSATDLGLGAQTDFDRVMMGVFDEEIGIWDPIFYTLDENSNVEFKAPHFSIYSVMAYSPSFGDINGHWADDYITSLAARGLVNGKDAQHFDPNGKISRAEFVSILVRLLDEKQVYGGGFKDVAKDAWYYDAISQALMYDIYAGAENGNFMPMEAITRQDMAAMIAKVYEERNGYLPSTDGVSFSDEASIIGYAVDAAKMMKQAGIVTGYEDGGFHPENTASRAEAVTMIYRLLQP